MLLFHCSWGSASLQGAPEKASAEHQKKKGKRADADDSSRARLRVRPSSHLVWNSLLDSVRDVNPTLRARDERSARPWAA